MASGPNAGHCSSRQPFPNGHKSHFLALNDERVLLIVVAFTRLLHFESFTFSPRRYVFLSTTPRAPRHVVGRASHTGRCATMPVSSVKTGLADASAASAADLDRRCPREVVSRMRDAKSLNRERPPRVP